MLDPLMWLHNFFRQKIRHQTNAALEKLRTSESTARYLLLSCMTPTQREQWEQGQWFTAIGNLSGREYDIGRGGSMVRIRGYSPLFDTIREAKLCVQIGEPNIPIADHYLAIKLMIENDEKAFREIAVIV
jgi:hypothetical protein